MVAQTGRHVYSNVPEGKIVKAHGSNMRVSYKNTRETAQAIKGMSVPKAISYLNAVLDKTRIVPMRRFNGGVGRHAQCKEHKWSQGRWPEKSAKLILSLLANIEGNSSAMEDVEAENLVVSHIQVCAAARGRRRTYRAHGRISRFASNPCHVELICQHRAAPVAKGEGKKAKKTLATA
ncbi:ribosomal protein L22/L17, eukaryotic/archaeal [Kipferlia bialata]|uniref:Ribosomal protein L22/L17, eukaryotic/archaeal n=1 Tax=Kipferlia bialata TaxID=797122 RepID=A0A9K3D5E6_9EUKA|nr:ribosomal protein L22/L17, eukaryotic/archaeal [Kipferlia bialata]|eukprot:g10628.t1